MSDPLNVSGVEHRPSSWVGFDEIPMTTPSEIRPGSAADEGRHSVAREESIEMESGRESVAVEERLDVEDGDRPVVTPLPTNEMITDPSKLGQPPIVHAMQEYSGSNSMEKDPPDHPIPSKRNAKIITTIYPENNSCAWVIPPRYEPSSMPNALRAEGVDIPQSDFVMAMEILTNDYRFRSFSTLYSRLITFWMVLSIVVLLVVLFMNTEGGLPIMIFCLVWIFVLFAGIIGCAIIRKQIRIGLRHSVQSANKVLIKNNILAGVEDRGQLSCHKVVINFLWFDIEDCIPDLERLIRIEASGGAVVYGGETLSASGKQLTKREIEDKAKQLILKYSQGYVKDTVKKRLVFPSRPGLGVSEFVPRHCAKQQCLCQYIDKKHFNRSPKKWYDHFV
ncbi:unnamed protein product [Auanema sp. JU1783]|nr:unnamed protein product [Auanema sp. JU1783]